MAAPPTPPIIATLNASTGTTTLVLIALLVGLGVAMVLTAVWLVRATRTDAPALAPLEAMGTRRFARADPVRRAALLTGARPDGAPDPVPTVPYGDGDEPAPEARPAAAEPEPAAAAERVAEVEPEGEAEPQPAAEPVPEPEPELATEAEPQPEPVEGGAIVADGQRSEPVTAPESS